MLPFHTDVICREVGYTTGYASCCDAYGNHYRDSFVHEVRCQGTETKLLDCPHTLLNSKISCKYASAVCVTEVNHDDGESPILMAHPHQTRTGIRSELSRQLLHVSKTNSFGQFGPNANESPVWIPPNSVFLKHQ